MESKELQIVHPSNMMKEEWLLSRKTIHAGELIIEHHIEPPDEIEIPPLSHHLMAFHLSDYGARQVSRFDGREYDGAMYSGEFWLLPSGLPSFYHWESTDECLIFMIDPTLLRRLTIETGCLNPDRAELLPILKSRDPQLEAIALAFKREMNQPQWGNRLYIDSLSNIFAIHLLRHYCGFKPTFKKYEGGLPKHKLRQAIDYIQAHFADNISLDVMATEVGMSRFYFCRLFKQSTGITPYQYLIKCRTERAKALLLRGKLSIADVALEVGFSNQSHLTKHFKHLVGVTPKKFSAQ